MIGTFSPVIFCCINVSSLDDTEMEEANVSSQFWQTLQDIEAQFETKMKK